MPTLDLQKYVNDFIGENAANIGGFARSLLSRGVALINIVSVVVVTPVVAFYMLLDWEEMVDDSRRAFAAALPRRGAPARA